MLTHARRRSRSPSHSSSHHHRRQRSSSPRPRSRNAHSTPTPLPFHARPLRKGDLETYKSMFSLYLDIQKGLVLEELDEREVRGRWKRFVSRWNRGELAEGWYDPETLRKAQASAAADNHISSRAPLPPNREREASKSIYDDDDDDGDGYGPALPSNSDMHTRTPRREKQSGPSIPNIQDLQVQRELEAESSLHSRSLLHQARKADRKLQGEHLEDVAPRAAAGTKDRQLERKAELRASNNAFASSKADATFAEVPESDLMGDEEAGLEGYKKTKADEERKKNEREIRREEILRARKEEREERIRAYREKEEKTMEGLVALARARFG